MTRGRPPLPASAPVASYLYLTVEDRTAICEALRQCGSLSEAIRVVFGPDRSPSVVYAAIRNDPFDFGAQVEEAKEQFRNTLRREIVRRGRDGIDKAVRFQGAIVGYEKEYDTNLLLAAARMALPEFLDKRSSQDVHISTSQPEPGIWSVSASEAMALSLESRRKLADVLREIKSNKARLIGDRATLIEQHREEAEADGDSLVEVTAPPDDPFSRMSEAEQADFLLH